ncbi:MAG: amidophosphoribosyltransferase [Actinomycetota bacterium]|nr:amidophosphoribosyltransferase [Actinomycetota bacterium]
MGQVKEACGVFGVYARDVDVPHLVFDGLFALQHRGQESAGMAVSDGDTVTVVKDMGLVTSVFDQRTLSSLQGHVALGHVRYSTTGPSTWQNSQPVYRSVGNAGFALGHNGNLTNVEELAEAAGMLPGIVASDSELVGELLARAYPAVDRVGGEADTDLEQALLEVLPRLEGAFAFGLLDATHLVGVRDPNGFRPLCLGRIDPTPGAPEGGWVVASETPALDIVGAELVREIEPGEMVVIDSDGPRSYRPFAPERIDPRLCVFEFVYFARPDSRLLGREVHAARHRMGERLALESPADADLVIGVPDSGVPAAEGFAARSGLPFGQGLVKNRYIGRTFIAPTHEARVDGVRRKLNPLRESVSGRRLVVVDDSIVRGTTTRQIVRMLRDAGAREVHLRISSPPFRWPCYYGIATPDRSELVAAGMPVDEIAGHLGADSVGYLSLDGLVGSVGAGDAGFCTACLTGRYPTRVPSAREPVASAHR